MSIAIICGKKVDMPGDSRRLFIWPCSRQENATRLIVCDRCLLAVWLHDFHGYAVSSQLEEHRDCTGRLREATTDEQEQAIRALEEP